MLLMPNLNKCLIQFANTEYSNSAIVLLNNQFFMGEKLKVNYSKYTEIDLKKKNRSCNSEKFNQQKRVAKSEHRFESKSSIKSTIIVPSIYLLFKIKQNDERSLTHEKIFKRVKNEIFMPVQIKIIENNLNKVLVEEYIKKRLFKFKEKNDRLLISIYKFKNLQESMFILSKLHKVRIDGQTLNVSFSFFKY